MNTDLVTRDHGDVSTTSIHATTAASVAAINA